MKAKKHFTVRTDRSGRKIFKCSACPKALHGKTAHENISRHFLQHMTNREYTCPDCQETFKRIDLLEKHTSWCSKVSLDYKYRGILVTVKPIQDVHYEFDPTIKRPYKCLKCSLRFVTFMCIRNHLTNHSEICPYECKICKRRFIRSGGFKSHYKLCEAKNVRGLGGRKKKELNTSVEAEVANQNNIEQKDSKNVDSDSDENDSKQNIKIIDEIKNEKNYLTDLSNMFSAKMKELANKSKPLSKERKLIAEQKKLIGAQHANIDYEDNDDPKYRIKTIDKIMNQTNDETDLNEYLLAKMKAKEHCKLMTNKQGKKIYKCIICPGFTTANGTIALFNRHFIKHMANRHYTCPDCGKVFIGRIDAFESHKDWCSKTSLDYKYRGVSINPSLKLGEHYEINPKIRRRYKCLKCSLNFVTLMCVRNHYPVHSEIHPYECKLCKKTFVRLFQFKNHYKLCELKNANGSLNQEEIQNRKTQNQNKDTNPKPTIKKIKKKRMDLDEYDEDNPKNRIRPIDKIIKMDNDETDPNKELLAKIRAKEHYTLTKDKNGQLIYNCIFCRQKTTTLVYLKRHFIKHFANRKYTCPDCGKVFIGRIDSYENHIQWCSITSQDYENRGVRANFSLKLDEHYVIDPNNEKKYKCLTCDAYLANVLCMRAHYHARHLDVHPFKCKICLRTFKRLFPFKSHYEICSNNAIVQEEGDTIIKDYLTLDSLETSNIRLVGREQVENDIKIDITENDTTDTTEPKKRELVLYEEKEYNIITNDFDEPLYVCVICEEYSPHVDEDSFKEHFLDIHVPQLQCPYCQRICDDNVDLNVHLLECNNNQNNTVIKTENDETNKPKPTCTICNQTFINKVRLQRHVKIDHAISYYPCDLCEKVYKTQKSANQCKLKHLQLYSVECKLCGKKFVDVTSLRSHFKATHTIDEKRCEICDLVCRNRFALQNHKWYNHRVHPKRECPNCGKIFTSKQSLATHMRHHIGVVCYLCGKHLKKNLDEHIARHKKEKKFGCDICSKKFYSRKLANDHGRKVHNIMMKWQMFNCTKCTRKFLNRTMLLEHEFQEHGK